MEYIKHYACIGCGDTVPCVIQVKHKTPQDFNKNYNGYCLFDGHPVTLYLLKNET